MSQVLINQYLAELHRLKKVSGTRRETVVREAFKDLLKGWGRQHDLVFSAEYAMKTAARDGIVVDGALLHSIRTPLGYWEAKDADDDLAAEIQKKFKKGYPRDNILFTDDVTAVLWQGGTQPVMECPVTDTARLEKLLKLFFGFERAEIGNFRKAVEQFKADLPAVLEELRAMIERAHAANTAFAEASAKFLQHAQEAINPGLTAADVREMLIQHILTEEIFSKVFDSEFHRDNNVARELYKLEETFFTGGLKKSTLKGLEAYYAAIRAAAAQIANHHEKQTFLKVIYENFYKVYNAKAADRLGVVYTPNEIVRFMIEGADWLCEKHFGRNLIDKDVEILDPATGTGTFICELLEHFRGQPKKLAHKYREELHANEVAILPYYVANLNIEATYAAITGEYEEFKNLCFVDTLDNVANQITPGGLTTTLSLFGGVSEENVERIRRQNNRKISVVIGNPPYNANQANENDNNKNREYPAVDARIKKTYIHESTAQKTKLYDMYARFFRWASDRLAADGVIAFVSNSSFIDSRTFDGFRKIVASEFNEIRIVDLKGNARTSGERRRQEGGNVFDDQIRVGVAVWFCVKKQGIHGCRIFYEAVRDYAKADEKREFLVAVRLSERPVVEIRPDANHNWLHLTTTDFAELMPLADRSVGHKPAESVFRISTNGVNTARDEWVYSHARDPLLRQMRFAVDEFNREQSRWSKVKEIDRSQLSKRLKWSEALLAKVQRGPAGQASASLVVRSHYRPFVGVDYYADTVFSDRLTANHFAMFGPTLRLANTCIAISAPGPAASFRTVASDCLCDWHFMGDTQMYSYFCYDEAGNRIDNITDWSLAEFTKHYQPGCGRSPSPQPSPASGRGSKAITKLAIFHYVHAVLHDPQYREKYAQNLKREFPRIPLYGRNGEASEATFWQWAAWGEALMALHIGYEQATPFALQRTDVPDAKARAAGQPPKCLLKADKGDGKGSNGHIAIDSETTLAGIPPAAWAYQLGNRCALEWVLDQYKEKKPKDPTIREKFDTYRFADHKEKVIDLLRRVTTVSVETVRIVEAMKGALR